MADADLHTQIARLEAEIDELAETLEGCRKALLLSKAAIAAGGIWILASFLVSFDPTTVIGATAAVIGGVVAFGSNLTTAKQTTTAMKAAETHRAELIDAINIRAVSAGGRGPSRH